MSRPSIPRNKLLSIKGTKLIPLLAIAKIKAPNAAPTTNFDASEPETLTNVWATANAVGNVLAKNV